MAHIGLENPDYVKSQTVCMTPTPEFTLNIHKTSKVSIRPSVKSRVGVIRTVCNLAVIIVFQTNNIFPNRHQLNYRP